ncbi:hypothetical protein C8R45DRAFT_543791 [Mycena sanguinolenta]|nr:hypothetical protein C8R45DRAFT_543791 [Mycena sanguinolenta]
MPSANRHRSGTAPLHVLGRPGFRWPSPAYNRVVSSSRPIFRPLTTLYSLVPQRVDPGFLRRLRLINLVTRCDTMIVRFPPTLRLRSSRVPPSASFSPPSPPSIVPGFRVPPLPSLPSPPPSTLSASLRLSPPWLRLIDALISFLNEQPPFLVCCTFACDAVLHPHSRWSCSIEDLRPTPTSIIALYLIASLSFVLVLGRICTFDFYHWISCFCVPTGARIWLEIHIAM